MLTKIRISDKDLKAFTRFTDAQKLNALDLLLTLFFPEQPNVEPIDERVSDWWDDHSEALITDREAYFEACSRLKSIGSLGGKARAKRVLSSSKHIDRDEDGNEKNDTETERDWTEEIYAEYPRKVAKPNALKAIEKALKTISGEDLLARTKMYAKAVSTWSADDKRFVPHPATWFNGARYNDDPQTWLRNGNGGVVTPKQIQALSEGVGGAKGAFVDIDERTKNVLANKEIFHREYCLEFSDADPDCLPLDFDCLTKPDQDRLFSKVRKYVENGAY